MFSLAAICLFLSCARAMIIDPTPDRHITIPNSEAEGKRIFVIGDVHGCYDELMTLLRQADVINPDRSIKDDVIVIFAGDIINKGPKNLEMIRWARANNVYNVFGNHELNVLRKPSKYSWTSALTPADFAYLRSVVYTISIPLYNVIVVHAGIMPDRGLNEQTEFIMTRMRNIEIRPDGSWVPHEDRRDPGDNWATTLPGPYRVIYGHDAGRGRDSQGNPIIQFHPFATGLDSRCVYGGKLSGVFLSRDGNSDTYEQVTCPKYDSRINFSDILQDFLP